VNRQNDEWRRSHCYGNQALYLHLDGVEAAAPQRRRSAKKAAKDDSGSVNGEIGEMKWRGGITGLPLLAGLVHTQIAGGWRQKMKGMARVLQRVKPVRRTLPRTALPLPLLYLPSPSSAPLACCAHNSVCLHAHNACRRRQRCRRYTHAKIFATLLTHRGIRRAVYSLSLSAALTPTTRH